MLENGDAVKNKEERTLYYTVKENDKLDVKVGLEDQDKTFVFKDVDPADTKKVDVSLKEDKVNLDVTKKDEQEVKQEEKKEETAKADSSNKSNTSESKKNNTASTNSSSNKNNSSSNSSKPSSKPSNSGNNSGTSKPSNNNSSNSSKPAEHTHNWIAQYKTVNVPEQGHNEQVLVQAAYDEQVPITEMREYSICSTCGADITGNTSAHMKAHMLNGENGNFHSEWRETVTGYNTVHHDAVYETRYVVDSPATTKQELTGYKCSGCGKTKAN